MSELKPCPFCGWEAELQPARDRSETTGHKEDAVVACRRCDAQVFGTTDDEAIAAWNRRIAALPQPITAETVPDSWPSRGPDFNRWYCDAAAFVALVQKHPSMWLKNWQLKYLDIRIDTRSGHFVLYDRDKQPVSPNAVLEAIAQRATVEVPGT